MIGGGECKVDTISFQNDLISLKSKDDVFTLLIHLGYLAFDSEKSTVRIPNNEIRKEFVSAVRDGSHKELSKIIHNSTELIEYTLEVNSKTVARAIEKVHSQATSSVFYNNEQALRSTIRFAYISAVDDYVEIQELLSGKGMLILSTFLKKFSGQVLLVRINYNEKSKKHECSIERISL